MSKKTKRIALAAAAAVLATGIAPLSGPATAPGAAAVDYTMPSLWEEYKDYFIMGTFGDWSSPQAQYHYRTNSPANALKLDGQIGSSNTANLSKAAYDQAVADIQADTSLTAAQQAAAIEEANQAVVLQDTTGPGQSENILQAIQQYNADNNLGPDEKKVVRGHVLAWHGGQQPNYFFCNGFSATGSGTAAECADGWASPETMLKRLDNYIRLMMAKYAPYKDIIYSWDVVNEPIDDYTGQVRNSDDYQVGQWGRVFRRPDLDSDPDARLQAESAWIRQAFASARHWSEVSGADWKLYLNDFQDSNKLYEPKMRQTVKVLEPIYAAGDIDGYGMQGRLSAAYPTIDMLREQIELGLTVADEISISEGDIRSDFLPNPNYDPAQPTRRVLAGDPQYESDETATGSVSLIGAANGNTYDVFNSPVMRRRDWPANGLDYMAIFSGDTSSVDSMLAVANRADVQQYQADFAADWMDLLIEYKDKVVAFQWDGTSDLGTFNSQTGGHLWAGELDWSMWGLPKIGDSFEKASFFAVIGAPARDQMRQAIAAAGALNQAAYSTEAWGKIARAKAAAAQLANARIYDIGGVDRVKNATARLNAAIGDAARESLSGLIDTVAGLDLGAFTAASAAGLPAALDAARDALEDPNGFDAAMAAAYATLRAAVARLAPRSPAHLTEALGVLVTVGAGFEHSRAGFTDASYKPFATALAAARAVLATDRAALTETKAQAAFDTLRAAIAGLAPVTDPPKAGKISPAPKPVIKGTAKVGKKLRVAKGAWPAGTSLKTQWYAGGKAIKKATKSTLKLTKALKGKKIRVKVTGTLSGHLKTAVTSKATKKVAKK